MFLVVVPVALSTSVILPTLIFILEASALLVYLLNQSAAVAAVLSLCLILLLQMAQSVSRSKPIHIWDSQTNHRVHNLKTAEEMFF